MRKALLTFLLLFVFLLTYSQSLTPRQLYQGLFEAVQLTAGSEYTLQGGFRWTNGVPLNLLNHYQVNQL